MPYYVLLIFGLLTALGLLVASNVVGSPISLLFGKEGFSPNRIQIYALVSSIVIAGLAVGLFYCVMQSMQDDYNMYQTSKNAIKKNSWRQYTWVMATPRMQ